ncbi:LacI family DNA-binding transcriptional regulator, partial [Weissella sp. DD23]|uniref:LacI family DNA-binding transcriptional regulator n=1 Tax=Weissella sp. DD23 TaxID=1777865 RepID=UPI001FA7F695
GKSTVSRYLNNGSISAKTRAKLDAVVKEYDYEPNRFAQSLKKNFQWHDWGCGPHICLICFDGDDAWHG